MQNSLLGIIGYPIGHALSPLMQNAALRALDLNYEYRAIEIHPDELETRVRALIAMGYLGLNVTIPHKQAVIPLLDEIDTTAQAIGAVNTIRVINGRSIGYNTDAPGFLKSVEPVRNTVFANPVLVIGAGGAARAVLYALLTELHPSAIMIAARTPTKTEKLIRDFSPWNIRQCALRSISFEKRSLEHASSTATVIINATSVGMSPRIDQTPLPGSVRLTPDQVAIDVVYNPMETTFLRNAAHDGARTLDGLGMLIYQGAAAFQIFTGETMPVSVVRTVLEERLKGLQNRS